MSKEFLFVEKADEILKISQDFIEINAMLNQIAMMQFLIDWNDECIKCKCEWHEFLDYLVHKFQNLSFQMQNK